MLLVTGAGGFVGSRICALAASRGMRVLAHSRRAGVGISWVADLRESGAVSRLATGEICAVVHCAAAIPSRSTAFMEDNAGAAQVLAAVLNGAGALRRIVHISSAAVYSLPQVGACRITEQTPLIDPVGIPGSAYAKSKRLVEQEFEALSVRRPEIAVTHVRASSVYGRGMVPTTLLPVLVSRAKNHDPFTLHGPRNYTQNFVNVEDVAALAVTLVSDTQTRGLSAVNAFSDDTYDLAALAALVRNTLGSRSSILDETNDEPFPDLEFENVRVKSLHRPFRRLCDHLGEVA